MVDMNYKYINHVKKEFGDKIRKAHVANVLQQVSITRSYDVILLNGVAQYFSNQDFLGVLKKAKFKLKKGGKIWLKEQLSCVKGSTCKTVYNEETKDWMRSLYCFA